MMMVSHGLFLFLLSFGQVSVLAQSFLSSSPSGRAKIPQQKTGIIVSSSGFFRKLDQQEQQQQPSSSLFLFNTVSTLRGGGGEEKHQQQNGEEHDLPGGVVLPGIIPKELITAITFFAVSFGKFYAKSLETNPIATKSITAGFLLGFSDFLAQRLEYPRRVVYGKKVDRKRTLSSVLVGLLYFGPAAHYWYDWVFRLIPSNTIGGILQKATLGQLIFGPSFTCVFFAAALLQSGKFSFASWLAKIRADLPRAMLAGVGYWPLVDLISFSFIPIQFIPLFVNGCALLWNIYLSLVANKPKATTTTPGDNKKP